MSNPNAPTTARTSAPPELSTEGLVLLYGSTPNGWKCTYALEILKQAGLIPGYTVCEVYLQTNEQFEPWFKAINPNCPFPGLVHCPCWHHQSRQGLTEVCALKTPSKQPRCPP